MKLIHGKGIYDSERQRMNGNGLLIYGSDIAACGSFDELYEQHPGANIIDWRDGYVMPGLINTHVHLEFTPGSDSYGTYVTESSDLHIQKARMHAKEMLLSGVTSARDLGSSMELVTRRETVSGKNFPKLFLAGAPLTQTKGHLFYLGGAADTEEELREAVATHFDAGCDCIKMMINGGQNTPGSLPERRAYDKKTIRATVDEAHRFGMTVAVHCLTTESFVNAMEGDADSIEHCACFERSASSGLLERVYQTQVMDSFRGNCRFFMAGFSNHYHLLDDARSGKKSATQEELFMLQQEEREAEIICNLIDLGMCPVIGTDAGFGLTYFNETWMELALLVERCGLSEADAIKAATENGASALQENKVGSLQSGYRADMIALSRNPLHDIRAFSDVQHVMSRGLVVS